MREKRAEERGKKKNIIEVKRIVEEQKIWNEKEEETKKLVSQRYHKQIHIFIKKVSEKMLMRKLQDYAIETKQRFVLRKGKVYSLSREERGKIHEFIKE